MKDLQHKRILITGVSRAGGIGNGIARYLAKQGATILLHGFATYDEKIAYQDAEQDYVYTLQKELTDEGYDVYVLPSSDLSVPENAENVISDCLEHVSYIDGMVLNHAYSTSGVFGQLDATNINTHLQVNVTSSLLMMQAFAKQCPENVRGAITLFTSGQYLGPMLSEISYAISKDAIIAIAKQTAPTLAAQNIQVNVINPGPTDTGYSFGGDYEGVRTKFPMKRWGTPEDVAKLVTFLQSDDSAWITGEVIASEGGFQR